jgi:nucleotidyltransferase/DNA polymerase involved in DNA repair
MGADFIASLPVAKFHGVGPVTAARMQRLGIETGADLRAKSLGFLQHRPPRGISASRTARTTGPSSPIVGANRPDLNRPSSET